MGFDVRFQLVFWRFLERISNAAYNIYRVSNDNVYISIIMSYQALGISMRQEDVV